MSEALANQCDASGFDATGCYWSIDADSGIGLICAQAISPGGPPFASCPAGLRQLTPPEIVDLHFACSKSTTNNNGCVSSISLVMAPAQGPGRVGTGNAFIESTAITLPVEVVWISCTATVVPPDS